MKKSRAEKALPKNGPTKRVGPGRLVSPSVRIQTAYAIRGVLWAGTLKDAKAMLEPGETILPVAIVPLDNPDALFQRAHDGYMRGACGHDGGINGALKALRLLRKRSNVGRARETFLSLCAAHRAKRGANTKDEPR